MSSTAGCDVFVWDGFCYATHAIFSVHVSLGGDINTTAEDLITFRNEFHFILLDLNTDKCDISIPNNQSLTHRRSILQNKYSLAPEIKVVGHPPFYFLIFFNNPLVSLKMIKFSIYFG